jgi:hypothetical protein
MMMILMMTATTRMPMCVVVVVAVGWRYPLDGGSARDIVDIPVDGTEIVEHHTSYSGTFGIVVVLS